MCSKVFQVFLPRQHADVVAQFQHGAGVDERVDITTAKAREHDGHRFDKSSDATVLPATLGFDTTMRRMEKAE